jgi:hypothetical protein
MNIKCLAAFVLLFITCYLILFLFKKRRDIREKFDQNFRQQCDDGELSPTDPVCLGYNHNSETCDNFPFSQDDNCDNSDYYESIPNLHVNRYDSTTNDTRVHYVNPNNPCCLKTCLNDFTYTTENLELFPNPRVQSGALKEMEHFNEYYIVSKCHNCVQNFERSLSLLENPEQLENQSQCEPE